MGRHERPIAARLQYHGRPESPAFYANNRCQPLERVTRLRIAYLSTADLSSRRANAIQTMQMCGAFAELGHEVHLLAVGHLGEQDTYFQTYGCSGNFEIHLTPPKRYKGYSIELTLRSLRSLRALSPDIAYGRHLESCAAASQFGHPVVYEAHDCSDRRRVRWLTQLLQAGRGYRGLVTINSELARQQRWKPPILVAHDGAPDTLSDGEAAVPVRGNRIRVGYIGSVYPGKGADWVARLASVLPEFDFEIVGGDGEAVSALGVQIPGNLRCRGKVCPAEALRARLDFDILLAPYAERVESAGGSDISRWMSPLKLFEYMASGRPMVCTDLPAIREVITDQHNGLLAKPGDLESWKTKIRRLADDPELAARIGCKALSDFRADYTWTARARHVSQFLQNRLDQA